VVVGVKRRRHAAVDDHVGVLPPVEQHADHLDVDAATPPHERQQQQQQQYRNNHR
jgi:hypothetical protein